MRDVKEANTKELTQSLITSYLPADKAFSLCVRLRANFTCERCGLLFNPNNMRYLMCSHYTKGVRFNPNNVLALCWDCHYWFSRYKVESTMWFMDKLGEERYQQLCDELEAVQIITTQDEVELTAYYNQLAHQLLKKRQEGEKGYLAFEPLNLNDPLNKCRSR